MEDLTLLETDNLIVKNINSYTISVDTILTELSSGTLYLLDSINKNITNNITTYKNGINYEFIFNTTSIIQLLLEQVKIH